MASIYRRWLAGVLAVFVFTCLVPAVLAVGIKPLRTELAIDPGSSATATIKVINPDPTPVRVRPEIEVYIENDAEGFPVAAQLAADDPRNIRNWITFEKDTLEIAPRSEVETKFTVTVPAGAEPGGRYAALVYSPVTEAGQSVQVRSRVASLILITVSGQQRREGEVVQFFVDQANLKGGEMLALTVDFSNLGNVHVKPKGSITLADSTGQQLTQIARYTDPQTGQVVVADAIPVNLAGGNVLPGSRRTFLPEWNNNVKDGKYLAKLNLTYGGDNPAAIEKTAEFEISENLTLEKFAIDQTDQSADFTLRLANSGTVAERPIGKISIVNEFDSVVAELALGSELPLVAPGETQTLTIPWLKKAVPAGNYTAKLESVYGYGANPLAAELDFSAGASNWGYLATGAGVILALGGAAVWLVRRRREVGSSNEPY